MVRNARVHQGNISAHDHDALKSITFEKPFRIASGAERAAANLFAKQWISESDV